MKLLGVAVLSTIAIGLSLIPQVFEAVADPSAVATSNENWKALFDQVQTEMTLKLDATKAGVSKEIERSRKYTYDSLSEFNNASAAWHDESKSLLSALNDRGFSMNESWMKVAELLLKKATLVEHNTAVFKVCTEMLGDRCTL